VHVKVPRLSKAAPVPFFIVCDFESFLVPVETVGKTGGLSLVDEHQVSGFCCYRVTDFDEYETPPYVYSGPNLMTKFYDHVMSESREICHIVTSAASMLPLTEKQVAEYARAVSCSNCGEAFSKDNHKTHHRCHISGKYLFPACNRCNLNLKPVTCTSKPSRKRNFTSTDEWAEEQYRQNFFLPVLFHILNLITPISSSNIFNANTSSAAIQITRSVSMTSKFLL